MSTEKSKPTETAMTADPLLAAGGNKLADIIVDFKMTGINEIRVDNAISKWTYLWYVAEWRSDNSWRLIKYTRKDSPNTDLKITISEKQAKELIEKLNLIPENQGFRSAFSWRRKSDIDYLNKWRTEKYGRK